MHVTVNTAALARELTFAIGAVSRQQSIPILSYFLLEAAPFGLKITAGDLDMFVSVQIEAEVKTPGSCAIPAKKLADYIRLTDAESVTIKETGHWVHVSAGATSKTKIATLAPESYPTLPAMPDDATLTLPAKEFGVAIQRILPCVSKTVDRFSLNSAMLQLRDEHAARLVSTDGHRLALAEFSAHSVDPKPKQKQWLIGMGTMAYLSKLSEMAQLGECFEFVVGESGVMFFRLGHRLVFSRGTAGNFPDYERAIPKGYESHFILDRTAMARGIARARLFADERSWGVAIRSVEEGLQIRAVSTDSGESDELVAAEHVGEQLEVGLNASYINDFLGSVGTDKVAVWHKDASTAVLFRPAPRGAEAEHARPYDYLVMPMRI